MDLQKILKDCVEQNASDLFIIPGAAAKAKINGNLVAITDRPLMPADCKDLIEQTISLTSNLSLEQVLTESDYDFSFAIPKLCRFRCNVYRQRGSFAAAYRMVSFEVPNAESLHIPKAVIDLAEMRTGMVLVTGLAGNGKSTTMACMVDHINRTRDAHVITIEDPIEYLHSHKLSLVSQREVPTDAPNFPRALRAALREAPNVIMLGEMRDEDTMTTAIRASETGHMVLSCLHTVGASSAINRIIDAFPYNTQQQVRVQLSMVLRAVVSQMLLPAKDGTLYPVFEIMVVNNAIKNMIRDGRTFQIDNVIYSGSMNRTMMSMDNELARLVKEGIIEESVAMQHAPNPEALQLFLRDR